MTTDTDAIERSLRGAPQASSSCSKLAVRPSTRA